MKAYASYEVSTRHVRCLPPACLQVWQIYLLTRQLVNLSTCLLILPTRQTYMNVTEWSLSLLDRAVNKMAVLRKNFIKQITPPIKNVIFAPTYMTFLTHAQRHNNKEPQKTHSIRTQEIRERAKYPTLKKNGEKPKL